MFKELILVELAMTYAAVKSSVADRFVFETSILLARILEIVPLELAFVSPATHVY